MFELHESARERFEDLATELLRALTTFLEPPPSENNRFTNIFKAKGITEKDVIGDVHVGLVGPQGESVGLTVAEAGGARTGLVGEGFRKLQALVSAMAKVRPFVRIASPEFVQKQVFEWLKAKHRHQTDLSCVDFVLQKLEGSAAEFRVLVPISELFVESPLVMGPVTIKTFPETLLEQLDSFAEPQHGTGVGPLTGRMRPHFQGLAAAEVSVFGEPIAAQRMAAESIKIAVSVLRFFAPAHLDQRVVSRIAEWGYAPERTATAFVLDPDGRCSSLSSSLIDAPGRAVLSDELVGFFRGIGMSEVLAIFGRDEWSDMETALLEGMSTFGRAALTPDHRERLVWYCAGLESLLLKDRSESIIQNLAERLAIFTYDGLEQRESAIADVREAYSLRSGFVHHGTSVPVEGLDAVGRFAHHGVRLFLRVATQCHRFSCRRQFVEEIDRLKLSGGR